VKILLINPPSINMIETNNASFVEEESGFYPPLGLLYIVSYLKKYSNFEVKVLDAQVEALNYQQINEQVKLYSPDLVGIHTSTFLLLDVLKVAHNIKGIDPRIHVNLGGPHVYIFPEQTIKFKPVDSLIIGEGEKTFTELANALNSKKSLEHIQGLVYKRQGQVYFNRAQEYIEDLDGLPFPSRISSPYLKYTSLLSANRVMTTFISSRGCPFKCIYCDRPHLGKKYRWRSADNIIQEIKECLALGIKEIVFFDDIFTMNRKRVLDICERIIKEEIKFRWSIRARVDTVDAEILGKLKKAGCERISFGVESGAQKVLDKLRKGITLEQARQAFKLCKDTGVSTLADFMIGSPGENVDDIERTIDFALELDPDYVQFTITTPYPATELYRVGLESGILKEDYWKAFANEPSPDFSPRYWEENISRAGLIELRKKAYRKFYLRPKYVFNSLLKLNSVGEFHKKAKAAFKLFSHSYLRLK